MPDTIADLDRRLDMERLAYTAAIECDDPACEDLHRKRMDDLLDRRLHCPQRCQA